MQQLLVTRLASRYVCSRLVLAIATSVDNRWTGLLESQNVIMDSPVHFC